MISLAPCFAKATAMAAPIPDEEPVTSAKWPSNRPAWETALATFVQADVVYMQISRRSPALISSSSKGDIKINLLTSADQLRRRR
jgi:hypothetical protein